MIHFLKLGPDDAIYISSGGSHLIKMRLNGGLMTVDYCIEAPGVEELAQAERLECLMLERSLGMMNEDLGGVS